MVTRIRELGSLLLSICALTFLLSKVRVLTETSPAPVLPPSSPATRLMLQVPDQQIPIPLPEVQITQIRNTWHAPRSERRRHEGQDIFAPVGTPVYSGTHGIVVRIGYAGRGGNAVSVLGAGGRTYYYAHLAGFAENLRIGDSVTSETLLGYVGRTGNARTTPSHLHFGVYDISGPINPLPLLVDRIQADYRHPALSNSHEGRIFRAATRHRRHRTHTRT